MYRVPERLAIMYPLKVSSWSKVAARQLRLAARDLSTSVEMTQRRGEMKEVPAPGRTGGSRTAPGYGVESGPVGAVREPPVLGRDIGPAHEAPRDRLEACAARADKSARARRKTTPR